LSVECCLVKTREAYQRQQGIAVTGSIDMPTAESAGEPKHPVSLRRPVLRPQPALRPLRVRDGQTGTAESQTGQSSNQQNATGQTPSQNSGQAQTSRLRLGSELAQSVEHDRSG